jgi:polyisoprenyl-phosphate glycosyltransferase
MKASVIIPAYNESLTIKDVILACSACSLVDEVIVVDDGSEDDTAAQAVAAGAQVLSYGQNKGKAYAVMHGVKVAKNQVILLLDADLIGFTSLHAESLILPIVMQKSEVTVGLFTKGRMKTDLAHTLAPGLSGQRCMLKDILVSMNNCDDARYAFEVHLNNWMKKNNISVLKVALEYVSHLTKEEKRGKKKGFSNRMEMYENIVSRFFKK